ncbi:HD-GYP domain-containing protein [Fodinicurvata fenggangensis]|uniref:HD-GYP domain-containing protein n=1 Tax=Fodinicurvata fenggangensis TaxID=1121830 RepID=UPI00047DAD39|nr:HD domain-containing phosphohydrolase [Fodinicurvata fenggangensis]
MTRNSDTSEPDTLALLEGAPDEDRMPRRLRRTGLLLTVAIVVIGLVVAAVSYSLIERRAEETRQAVEERTGILLEGREETFRTWLNGRQQVSRQISTNEFIRVFATETALGGEDEALDAGSGEQARYLSLVLDDFVARNPVERAYILSSEGHQILSSDSAGLSEEQIAAARRVSEVGDTIIPGVREDDGRLLMDMFQPIFAIQAGNTGDSEIAEDEVVGVIMTVLPVAEEMTRLLANRPLSDPGETTRLLQQADEGALQVVAPERAGLVPLQEERVQPLEPGESGQLRFPFGVRTSLLGEQEVYSQGRQIQGTPWILVQETDLSSALVTQGQERLQIILLSVLIFCVISAFLILVWLRQKGAFVEAMAEQYRSLAARIEAHRKLLAGINDSIREWIGLKNRDGVYVYANPALARAVGRPEDQIVGTNDEAVFGYHTAQRLKEDDSAALAGESRPAEVHDLYLQDELRHIEISRVPLKGERGDIDGIVLVGRDMTQQIEERRRREKAMLQTAEAFDRLVGRIDPHLSGHSDLVAQLAATVAEKMELSSDEHLTLQIAAHLAQIGKVLIPASIVAKESRLDAQELEIMNRHIEYASEIISGIDYDLPVRETVEQMYERLDGTGYPRGLSGDEIGLLARILAVCDVVAARIRTRSYRGRISLGEVIAILRDNTHRYDENVITALDESVQQNDVEVMLESQSITPEDEGNV